MTYPSLSNGSSRLLRAAFLLTLWLAAAITPANAQTITGSISGIVTDNTGALLPDTTVTARNLDTNVTTDTTTNKSGEYSIRFLQIGRYTLTAKRSGFKERTTEPFALEVEQTAKIDVALTVGSANETVTVSNELAPILNTEDATIATTFTSNTIESIPLNGRNFSSISLFLPGAVTTQPTGFTGSNGIERNTGSNGQASINGNRNQTNNYLLDGVEINETINNLIGYNPNPDALAEMKVISANAPAEYGNVNGGDMILVTKSGTNQYHGSLSAFLEDYKLDANTWANKNFPAGTAFTPRNPYTQTQFSATFGGPIIKDKLFFFVDYMGARYHKGGLSTSTVLSAKMRGGDFSELLDPAIMCSSTGGVCASNNSLVQLYDPTNGFAPYAGNLNIPINNPVAKYLIAHPQYYPLPNIAPGANSPVQNNFRGSSQNHVYNNQGDVKIDWTPTRIDRISGRYLQGESGDGTVNPLAVTFPGSSFYPTKGIALNWIRTISPAIVNEARAGFTRIRWTQGEPTDTTGAFGLTGNSVVGIPGTQAFSGFSGQSVSGFTTLGNPAGGTVFIDNIFTYADDLTWQRGKHLLKGGVQFVRYQQNNFYPGNDGALGQFQYNGNFTQNPFVLAANNPTQPSGEGYSGADFVLDRVYFEGVGAVTGRTGQRQWRSAYFAQDDWKMSPKLTLNLGLRYEFFQPIYEVNNKEANVNLATGTAELAGVNGNSRALYNATYNNFMPRLGFAYQARERFVVRGGFGITKYLEGTGANLRLTYNPPFQPSLELTGSAPSTAGPGVFFKVENGFSTSANPNFSGTTYRAWVPNLKPSSINEYSLTTEYELNNFTSITIGYVGESGQHLIQAVAANQLAQPCVIGGVVQSNPNSAACSLADPAPYQALVGQSGGVVETASEGMMNYNALQISYRQRATKGLEYTVNYTYGRAMTNTDGFFGVPDINGPSPYAENAYNNHAEYGPVGQDVRNNLNGTAVYALPFGRGKMLGGLPRLANELAGGWKVSVTAIAYSGFPLTLSAASNNAYTNNKAQRPDHVGDIHVVNRSVLNWFGTDPSVHTAYVQPAAGTYGNAAVGSERGPGYQQYDFSAFKDFTVYHENALGFRLDAFNALNQTSLGNPDTNIGDSTFGQITSVRSPQRQIQLSLRYSF